MPMVETRPSRLTIFAWAMLICVSPIPAGTAPVEYVLVPVQSELVVRVYRGGAAAWLAHDHVIRATRFTGIFGGNPAQPTGATGTLTIETDSLEADAPELRQKYGLPQTLGATDRQKIEATMLGQGQLAAAQNPNILFRLSQATPTGPERWDVTGELTLHGTVRPLQFPVTVQVEADMVRVSGTVTFRQSAFGIRPYTMFFGAVRNHDKVEVVFDVLAKRRGP